MVTTEDLHYTDFSDLKWTDVDRKNLKYYISLAHNSRIFLFPARF